MGGIYSKSNTDIDEYQPDVSVGEVLVGNDPRSPTSDISRTPLQSADQKCQKITKNVDLTKECFEKYDKNLPLNPAVRAVMNQFDPRSPTLDFQRTPLAVLIKNPELIAAYNQMNSSDLNASNASCNEADITNEVIQVCPKNLENDLANLSICINSASSEEDTKTIEILNINTENSLTNDPTLMIKSDAKVPIVGLLETNLDYIETDLDTVKRKKKKSVKIDEKRADKLDSDNKIINPTLKNIELIKDLSTKDPRSPSIGIDRTPILIVEPNKKGETPIQCSKILDVDLPVKEIFNYNMNFQQKCTEKKIITHNSDSLLIYEDNEITVSAIKKTPFNNQNEGSRTPLASMINIDSKSKVNTPISKDQSVAKVNKSKIPIKVKSINGNHTAALSNILTPTKGNLIIVSKKNRRIVMNASENTPPQPRQARWDQDNSVIL